MIWLHGLYLHMCMMCMPELIGSCIIIYFKSKIKSKSKLLNSAVSNPQDCSNRFTLYFPAKSLAHLFNQTPSQASSYAVINM